MTYIKTCSVEETVEEGRKLGGMLGKGDVVCLVGELGAGKTAFVSGMASALGVKGRVTSPTFAIVNEYPGETPLYHFDVFRVAGPEEIFETGFDEYMDGSGVVVIEWADRIKEILPDSCIWVNISRDEDAGEDTRTIAVKFAEDG